MSLSRILTYISLLLASFVYTPSYSEALAEGPNSVSEMGSDWNLMLVGGSMNTCSSMATSACRSVDWFDPDTMRHTISVELSTDRLQRLSQAHGWQHREDVKNQVKQALRSLAQHQPNTISLSELTQHFRDNEQSLWRELYNSEWRMIRDYLQVPEQADIIEVSKPQLSLQSEGMELFRQFSQRAKTIADKNEEEPLILVVTASAQDSFDAVGFYQQTFREFAVNAKWLPIDASFGHAVAAANNGDESACTQIDVIRAHVQGTYDRSRVYPWLAEQQVAACNNPEELINLVQSAHGIFINGGDQSLTRQAFFAPNGTAFPWLTVIKERLAEGSLIVGGTSAGTAVMTSLPMITNGSSLQALREGAVARHAPPPFDCERLATCAPAAAEDSLTYLSAGGLQLFPFGLLDTHFSERGRYARLLELLAASDAKLAVGVDETTALLVDTRTGKFEVSGAHGVVFLSHAQRTGEQISGRFSYLRHGSSGELSAQTGLVSVQFNDTAHPDNQEFIRPGSGRFLRDRSLTDAINTCEASPLFSGMQEQVRTVLDIDEHSTTAHQGGGCEIHLGVIGFLSPR